MKLLCISEDWIKTDNPNQRIYGPKFLEECTITDTSNFGYQLLGYNPYCWYEKCYFIPISDKDETEYAEKVLEEIFVNK